MVSSPVMRLIPRLQRTSLETNMKISPMTKLQTGFLVPTPIVLPLKSKIMVTRHSRLGILILVLRSTRKQYVISTNTLSPATMTRRNYGISYSLSDLHYSITLPSCKTSKATSAMPRRMLPRLWLWKNFRR